MAPTRPFVSVIVPTYRRPAQLAECLRAFTRLDYPRDCFEVVVVDDGSGAPPEETVAAVGHEIKTSLVVAEHRGPAAARNVGATRAQGELLAFADDDCAVDAGWLQAFATRFAAGPRDMLGGRTVNALPQNAYSTGSQLLIDYLYEYYNDGPDSARFFTSNNLAVPTDRFNAIGGFDTTFLLPAAEDRELCIRWRSLGYRLVYVPDAVVLHAHPLTLRLFWRQHLNYGRGAFRLHSLLARRRQAPIRVEPPMFYLRLVTYPLSCAHSRSRAGMTALFVLSQIANAIGFFGERHRMAGR